MVMAKTDQDFTIWEGDTKSVVITVTDENNNPVDLIDFTIQWYVRRNLNDRINRIYKDTTSGITVTDMAHGIFTINISPTDTQGLNGQYYHEVKMIDQLGNTVTVTTGRMFINPTLYNK